MQKSCGGYRAAEDHRQELTNIKAAGIIKKPNPKGSGQKGIRGIKAVGPLSSRFHARGGDADVEGQDFRDFAVPGVLGDCLVLTDCGSVLAARLSPRRLTGLVA